MNFLWPSSWFSGWLPCLQQRVETRGSPRSFRTPAVLWMYDSMTTWTHILISTFTGKKVYQDLQWTLQGTSESKYALTVRRTCTRNSSLRGQRLGLSRHISCPVGSGTTLGLKSAHLVLEGQFTLLPTISDQQPDHLSQPAPHEAAES